MNEKELRKADQWLYTAIHEAAHAITSEVLDPGSVKSIVIESPTKGYIERLRAGDPFVDGVVAYAGSVAVQQHARIIQDHNHEVRYTGEEPVPVFENNLFDKPRQLDDQHVEEALNEMRLQGWNRSRKRDQIRREAVRLIYKHRQAKLNVEKALVEKANGRGSVRLDRAEFLAAAGFVDLDPVAQLEKRRQALEAR